jgi:hypothetical protein
MFNLWLRLVTYDRHRGNGIRRDESTADAAFVIH